MLYYNDRQVIAGCHFYLLDKCQSLIKENKRKRKETKKVSLLFFFYYNKVKKVGEVYAL